MWSVYRLAARAALWRTTPNAALVDLPILLGWTTLLAAVRIGLQFLDTRMSGSFNPYGLNALAAVLAIELAVAGLFVRPGGRVTALAAMFALSVFADIATAGIRLVPLLATKIGSSGIWSSTYMAAAGYGAEIIWWIGAMVCVVGSLEQESVPRRIARVAALWAALFAANALVPHLPVFAAGDFDVRDANWWEFLRAKYAASHGQAAQAANGDLAHVTQAQAALLQAEVARLAPSRKGGTAIYALGIAGWASLDVFAKEIDGGLASIARTLPIKDRTLRLINNPATLATVPLASLHNFNAAVHAVGNVMNKDDDVLVLLMTSHGDRKGFALQLPDQAPIDLTPKQVAETLDHEGIKYRVVIVSACFSGIFLPPLANDDTIVVTAADDEHTSFGCAPERDWTYFGDAFLRQSLQPGTDFEQAFARARTLIQGWELMDHAPPSNPQAHFGPALVAKLAPFFAAPPGADGQ
ncbi:MAG: C13 family peptidase [Xanthobacteraceae bacterium]